MGPGRAGKSSTWPLLAFFSCTGGRQNRRDGTIRPQRHQIWRRPVQLGRADVAAGPHARAPSQPPVETRRKVVAGRRAKAVGEGRCIGAAAGVGGRASLKVGEGRRAGGWDDRTGSPAAEQGKGRALSTMDACPLPAHRRGKCPCGRRPGKVGPQPRGELARPRRHPRARRADVAPWASPHLDISHTGALQPGELNRGRADWRWRG
jgi:hypothetical protein